MKKVLMIAVMWLPVVAMAQNDWEVPDKVETTTTSTTGTTTAAAIPNPDAKYLTGAVPVKDGKVVFEQTINAPGKSADQIYDILLDLVERMARGGNQSEQSRVVIQDKEKHQIVADFYKWLVFTNKALVLDRTHLRFYLIINCEDGKATAEMTRISYLYEEERDPQRYTAEEWITDEECMNKEHTKLFRMNGKFRRKTIDRKDFIFNKLEEELNK